MKSVKFIKATMLILPLLLTLSCDKEDVVPEEVPVSNSMALGSFQATSFTVNLTGTFDGAEKTDLIKGKRGVMYCVKSDDAESKFKEWLNGNDNPGCTIIDKADFSGTSMKCLITGLTANTEYSYCLFLQRANGNREISAMSTFKTQPFNPEMKSFDVKGVECFVAFAEGKIIIDDKDGSYCETGVLISEDMNCDINNSAIFKQKGVYSPDINARMDGLKSDTHYYCRMYVKYPVSDGKFDYVYGQTKIIRTKDFNVVAVDLGVSVYWASYNVGAESPEESGNYYAWGEVVPKKTYSWATYKLQQNQKYNTDTLSSTVTSIKLLERSEDAANYNWGGEWRITTNAEFEELRDNTWFYAAERNGINGFRIVSKINGNEIFVPYAGFMRDDVIHGKGKAIVFFLRDLYFCRSMYGYYYWQVWAEENHFEFSRWDGVAIRPVYPKE